MSKQPTQPQPSINYMWIAIIGGGIGWLIGLSVSEVVSIVITSLTGSAAAIITVMSGLEKNAADDTESPKDNKLTQWRIK